MSSFASATDDTFVTISAVRLKELQELEAKLPKLIEEAVKEHKRSNLEKLHARDKANPAAVNARVKRYAEKHREEINRRLREERHAEKLEKQRLIASTTMITTDTSEPPLRPTAIVRTVAPQSSPTLTAREGVTPIPHPYPTVKTDVTVRFDA